MEPPRYPQIDEGNGYTDTFRITRFDISGDQFTLKTRIREGFLKRQCTQLGFPGNTITMYYRDGSPNKAHDQMVSAIQKQGIKFFIAFARVIPRDVTRVGWMHLVKPHLQQVFSDDIIETIDKIESR